MDVSSHAPGTPDWVDLMSPDPEASRAFYARVLGWTYRVGPPESGYYAMALVRDRMVAGVGPMPPGTKAPSAWVVYFETRDADATAAAIESNGGRITMGPMDVMDSGRLIVATDPTGATFGIWQPKEHKGFQVAMESGSAGWFELMSKDLPKAVGFYKSLNGLPIDNGNVPGMDYFIVKNGEQMVAGLMGMHGAPETMPSQWKVYFNVDDTDAALMRAREAGGSVMMEPMDSPYGRMAILTDPFGAIFAVIQPPKQG